MRRSIVKLFIGLWITLVLPVPALAAAITGVSIEPAAGGAERIIFTTDGPVSVNRSFVLPEPERVVVDMPAVRATGVALPAGYQGGFVRNLRFGQFDPVTSRLVLDLSVPARILRAHPEGNNRLVVEILPTRPVVGGVATGAVTAPVMAAPVSPFEAMSAPTPPVKVEAEKKLIVIDAGHGGQDPGALGKSGTREKMVTLRFAEALKSALLRTGRYRVLMTREGDMYIPLQGRVDIARRAKGDVFLSLHADSTPRGDARGVSVYTLSDTASDEEAAALADRENKSDIIAGLDLDTADADVASILIDLTQRETMNKSAVLADTIVADLHPKITKLPRTHRFAGFRVLKAPDIPSVLIEMGFLSNAADEKLLGSKEYEDLLTSSIVRALDTYTQE